MSQFKAYHLFCQFYQFQPLPVTKTTYLNYIAFLSHSLKSYNSIMNYLSVLKHINLTLRYDTTFMDDYDCHMLKKAVKRCVKESVNRKHPITVSILYNCFRLFTSCPLHLCMKALFLIAFFSLLRKSNLVPLARAQVSSSSGCFLRRRDLLFTPDGVVLRVFKTKTLQFNERVLEIPLPHIPNSIFCPVQALKEYLAVTHVDPDMPLFCLPSGGHMCPIYAHYLTSFLKVLLKRNFRIHFFCIKINFKPQL